MAGIGTSQATRHRFAIRRQRQEIALEITHHHQVHEQQIDRRVPGAFADAKRGAVDPGRPGVDGGQRARDAEAAVLVAVPVDSGARLQLVEQLLDEAHDGARLLAVWRVRRCQPRRDATPPPGAPS